MIHLVLGLVVAIAELDAAPTRALQAGIDLRDGLTTHLVRLDAGMRLNGWQVRAVVDPFFFFDGEHDLDLMVTLPMSPEWGILSGWRAVTIALADGAYWEHSVLAGLTAELPSLFQGALRFQVAAELSLVTLTHGTALPTQAFPLFSGHATFIESTEFALALRGYHAFSL